jgi:hypothetical protein
MLVIGTTTVVCVVGWLEVEMGVGVGAVYVGTFTLIGMGAGVGDETIRFEEGMETCCVGVGVGDEAI